MQQFKIETSRYTKEKMGKRCQEGCKAVARDHKLKTKGRQRRELEEKT